MHYRYHILLLLVITVLIVVLDQYIRSRENSGQDRLEGFDCSQTLLSGGSVNNSHKTAFVCNGEYCKNSGGGNGCCIDVGAVAPVPTCTTINKHYIVSGDDGRIINETKRACGDDNYSLNPLSGKPLCEYDENKERCQPTKYYPSNPKQPDCHSYSPQPSGSGGHRENNKYQYYEECVKMTNAGECVMRGTNGPIKCPPNDSYGAIKTASQCMNPSDENPSGYGCYGTNGNFIPPNKDGSCPDNGQN